VGAPIEQSRIQTYLNTQVPGWAGVGVRNVELVGSGWESEIIGFVADLPTGPLQLVLRMYTGDRGEAKAELEGNGMRRLHAAGFPVPRIHHQEKSQEPLGRPFLLMDRVDGTDIWGMFGDERSDEATRIQHSFGDLLVQLHRIDPNLLSSAGGEDPHGHIRMTLGEWRTVANGIGRDEFAILDWFEDQVSSLTPLPPSVTHNDFHPGNILRAHDGTMTVLDWTGVRVSDPRFDLAWTLLLLELYAAADARTRVQSWYESQVPAPDLEFFTAAAILRRLFSLVVSLTAGPEALGMRSGVEEQMRAELDRSQHLHDRLVAITGLGLPGYDALAG
jgi:aminoglycoside phosphotransferase (APT) family kinase protein